MARKKQKRIPLEDARNTLARIWLAGGGAAFLLLAVQSILGKYEGQMQEVWSWFVPTVLPTISLMLGVIGAGALAETTDEKWVKVSYYDISKYLSAFYLAILALTLLLQPFTDKPPMQLYTLTNYWMGPLQGMVVGVLGILFTSQEQKRAAKEATPDAQP
jgi:hypothetical protein